MASKITATIEKTDATILSINIESEKPIIENISIFGELGKIGIASYVAKRRLDNTIDGKGNAFVKVLDYHTSSTLREMDIDTFIEKSHVLSDDEKRIGLITRTLKDGKVICTAVKVGTKEFTNVECIITATNSLEKRVKLAKKAVQDKGYIFISLDSYKDISALHGISKSDFVAFSVSSNKEESEDK